MHALWQAVESTLPDDLQTPAHINTKVAWRLVAGRSRTAASGETGWTDATSGRPIFLQ